MVLPREIAAARVLLDWSQADLAAASGLSLRAISQIENEKSNPAQATMTAIELAFDRAGVAFKDRGVFLVENSTKVLEGERRFQILFEDIAHVTAGLNGPQAELLIDGADESLTPDYLVATVQMLRSKGLIMRHLVRHGDRFLRGALSEYRWLPEDSFINQSIFIYGGVVAIASVSEPKIFLHRDAHLAAFQRGRFDLLWGLLEQPDRTEAPHVFEL